MDQMIHVHGNFDTHKTQTADVIIRTSPEMRRGGVDRVAVLVGGL